jgi:hypothetical protein
MTHRDPVKSVPSWASIVSTILPSPEGERDLHRLGHEVSNHLRVGVEQAIDARARLGEDRFVDVHHRDLIADPMREIRRVYEFVGCELTPSAADAIEAWQVENRAGAHGTHRYTPEQFGLRADRLRSEYDFYVNHFDIALEG